MKAIHKKMSILLAGFLNGLNLCPSMGMGRNYVSDTLGSLQQAELSTYDNGFDADAAMLNEDWGNVKRDITNSYNKAKNELEKSTASE